MMSVDVVFWFIMGFVTCAFVAGGISVLYEMYMRRKTHKD